MSVFVYKAIKVLLEGIEMPNWLIAKVFMYEKLRCSLWIIADRPQLKVHILFIAEAFNAKIKMLEWVFTFRPVN
jgi:hypothetical protein